MINSSKRFSLKAGMVSIRKRPFVLIIVLLSFCLICPTSLYLIDIVPRYVFLSIPPPDHYQGMVLGEWSNTARSVYGGVFNRFFVFREEAVVSYDSSNGIESWQSVVDYFDTKMSDQGWVRTEKYLPCSSFLPEADFLKDVKDGYVSYLRKENENLYNYDDSDFACLAVWTDKGEANVFNIVLETINPSFLTQMMKFFSL